MSSETIHSTKHIRCVHTMYYAIETHQCLKTWLDLLKPVDFKEHIMCRAAGSSIDPQTLLRLANPTTKRLQTTYTSSRLYTLSCYHSLFLVSTSPFKSRSFDCDTSYKCLVISVHSINILQRAYAQNCLHI